AAPRRSELDPERAGLDDLRQDRNLPQRRATAGADPQVDVVEPDRAKHEATSPQTADADVGLEPCQLQEMRPGLAFERIGRDAVDDDASEPWLNGDALDTSRMAKGRGGAAPPTLPPR